MSTEAITVTCLCGAKLTYTGAYPSTQVFKFYAAHQVCLDRGRPLVMWGGDQA